MRSRGAKNAQERKAEGKRQKAEPEHRDRAVI
jgi:hypothetical protein